VVFVKVRRKDGIVAFDVLIGLAMLR